MPELGKIKKDSHRNKFVWHACEECGKERWVQIVGGLPESHNCKDCPRSGEKSNHWKGGRKSDGKGYIMVLLAPDDFFLPMADKQAYVFEHRLVMAKNLNRCLLSWEVVHHKNGIKDDNRIENLQLFKSQTSHLPSILMVRKINQLEKEVRLLRQRVTLLEAENILLKQVEGNFVRF